MGVLALGLHRHLCKMCVLNGPVTHAAIWMVPSPHPSACRSKRPGQELLYTGSHALGPERQCPIRQVASSLALRQGPV